MAVLPVLSLNLGCGSAGISNKSESLFAYLLGSKNRRVHPPTAQTYFPPKPKFNLNINLLVINIILYFLSFG
jgi:hypothetical protein